MPDSQFFFATMAKAGARRQLFGTEAGHPMGRAVCQSNLAFHVLNIEHTRCILGGVGLEKGSRVAEEHILSHEPPG